MRGLILFLMMVVGTLSMQATDYPYLTFELSDGSKASVSVTPDVALTFNGNTLTIGTKSFTLTNLSKPSTTCRVIRSAKTRCITASI